MTSRLHRHWIRLLTLGLLLGGMSIARASTPSIWISDSTGHLGTVHASNGDVHVVGQISVGGTPVVMTDIAISPAGALYGVDATTTTSSLYRINPLTANATFVGALGTVVNSLVFGLDGKLYAANDSLWTINTATGLAHDIGNAGTTYHSDGDLAFLHGTLYLSGCAVADPALCGSTHLISLNTSTGAGTDIGDTHLNLLYGLAASDVTLFGLSGDSTANADHFLYTINPATGQASTLVAFTGDSMGPIYGAALVPVPESRMSTLMLAGLVVLGAAAMRRRA